MASHLEIPITAISSLDYCSSHLEDCNSFPDHLLASSVAPPIHSPPWNLSGLSVVSKTLWWLFIPDKVEMFQHDSGPWWLLITPLSHVPNPQSCITATLTFFIYKKWSYSCFSRDIFTYYSPCPGHSSHLSLDLCGPSFLLAQGLLSDPTRPSQVSWLCDWLSCTISVIAFITLF